MTAVAERLVPHDATRVLRSDGLLVLVVAVATSLPLFWGLFHGISQDTWLALLAGHEIAAHGLPAHDTWTVLASGHHWIDQQWLGQLVLAELDRLGGLRLVLVAAAGAEAAALVTVILFARRSGASARAVTWVAVLVFPALWSIPRTQTFAFPLFALLVILLVNDSRAPSRRVLLTLPLLAVWANVHGSVVLAAGLVSIHGLCAIKRRHRLTAGLLVAAPWLCVLASPYAADLPHYYREMLLSGDMARFVTEWQPTQLTLATVPFFALAGSTVFLAGRVGRGLTRTEAALLTVTGVAALLALRNMAWFSLTALTVIPLLLQQAIRDRRPSEQANRLLGIAGIGLLGAMLATVAATPEAGLRSFPLQAAASAARAAGANGRVFATATYADWLLWQEPRLRGRLAFDARFELLDTSQLQELANASSGVIALPLLRDYRVFVVDSAATATVDALRACGYTTAAAEDHVDVLVRGGARRPTRRCANAVVRRT